MAMMPVVHLQKSRCLQLDYWQAHEIAIFATIENYETHPNEITSIKTLISICYYRRLVDDLKSLNLFKTI